LKKITKSKEQPIKKPMLSSARSANAASSYISSLGHEGEHHKLKKSKIDSLMKSIKRDIELQHKLSKHYYTKISNGSDSFTAEIGNFKVKVNTNDAKKVKKICENEGGEFRYDTVMNEFHYNGTVKVNSDLIKRQRLYAEMKVENISKIIRQSSSKGAQINSGDKLTDEGYRFIYAALFDETKKITDEEIVDFLRGSGFGDELVQTGLTRWVYLKDAIQANLYEKWTDDENVNLVIRSVMTSTFLQGLIHLYKNIRLTKQSNGKYALDEVFSQLAASFQSVKEKRDKKLVLIQQAVGSPEELDVLMNLADQFNRPQLSAQQMEQVSLQYNKTKSKEVFDAIKKSIKTNILNQVRQRFPVYASTDDKTLTKTLKSLDNYPSTGEFNNNTLLSISRSMVNANATSQLLKPVTGEEHEYRKSLVKKYALELDGFAKQDDPNAINKLVQIVREILSMQQYAVAIKIINHYINIKYKLFKGLGELIKKPSHHRNKVNQTSMAMILSE